MTSIAETTSPTVSNTNDVVPLATMIPPAAPTDAAPRSIVEAPPPPEAAVTKSTTPVLNFASSKKSKLGKAAAVDTAVSVTEEEKTKSLEASITEKSPWASINDMLVQNRCWLCQTPFPRGKAKKVFQVSHLLEYFSKRQRLEKQEVLVNDIKKENEVITTEPPGDIKSDHLRRCYESYLKLMSEDDGNDEKLMNEFRDNEVEPWMSGLICGIPLECKEELILFVPQKTDSSNNSTTTTNNKNKSVSNDGKPEVFSFLKKGSKDYCPPGCGCDNPWQFLS